MDGGHSSTLLSIAGRIPFFFWFVGLDFPLSLVIFLIPPQRACNVNNCATARITLPDGAVKEGRKWETVPLDIAKELSKSLAANALIAQVNGVLWDMTRPLEGDCELKFFTFKEDEGRDTFWHSSAHILGQVR